MKLLALDGNSIINRAFYGIKLLSNKNGEFTNAIYGFLMILNKLKEQEKPDAIVAAFDLRAPTFRHEMYKEYKAGRKGMPDELAAQMPVLKEILPLAGITVLEKESYEADDILGTLAKAAEKNGWFCSIATGDRDSLQLIDDKTTVLLACTKAGQPEITLYDKDKIFSEYGVSPKQMIDIKALMGDSSDNIPGVAGVGQKTALDLIQKFGTVEELYKKLDTAEMRDTLRLKLSAGKEMAFTSYKLGEIFSDVPVSVDFDVFRQAPANLPKLTAVLSRLELFKIIEKWGLKDVTPAFEENKDEEKPEDIIFSYNPDINKMILEIKNEKRIFSATSFTGNGLKGFAVFANNTAYIFNDDTDTFKKLADLNLPVVTNDIKPLYRNFKKYNKEDFDISLAAYLFNPSAASYDIERLLKEYSVSTGEAAGSEDREASKLGIYALGIKKLYTIFAEKLKENGQNELFYNIEMPLASVLADMESIGFSIDAEGLKRYGEELGKSIGVLQATVYEQVGYEFNLNSPKQLGEALFEKLGLPAKKKTKSGYSTGAEVLEGLRFLHPAVDNLLEYRQLTKLKSTYIDSMADYIESDGRIHTTFNQTETRTGRISSLEPNLQNIPVRKEAGRELRRFFVAAEGCVLCDADYSQIELRVLAHMANDSNMIEAFLNGMDIHTSTAAKVFNMPVEAVTPLMRSRAKAVNFGIVYGIGAFSLSQDLGISFGEAKSYIKGYMDTYKGIAEYMESTVSDAKKKGYVTTLFGRRRYLPELNASNAALRAFGERVARNMPVQGTAADIIKIAMINVSKALKAEGMKSRLILQVHDELIVEAPLNEAARAEEILKHEMENAVKLSVPVTADVHTGKTWFSAKV